MHAALTEFAKQNLVQQAVLLVDDAEHLLPDFVKNQLGGQLFGPSCRRTDLDALFECRNAYFEKLHRKRSRSSKGISVSKACANTRLLNSSMLSSRLI